jgi:hypothetical protein
MTRLLSLLRTWLTALLASDAAKPRERIADDYRRMFWPGHDGAHDN